MDRFLPLLASQLKTQGITIRDADIPGEIARLDPGQPPLGSSPGAATLLVDVALSPEEKAFALAWGCGIRWAIEVTDAADREPQSLRFTRRDLARPRLLAVRDHAWMRASESLADARWESWKAFDAYRNVNLLALEKTLGKPWPPLVPLHGPDEVRYGLREALRVGAGGRSLWWTVVKLEPLAPGHVSLVVRDERNVETSAVVPVKGATWQGLAVVVENLDRNLELCRTAS